MFNRDVIRALGLVTQLGISMLTPVLLCVFIGVKLNQHFHTQHWFLPFLLLGIGAGARNVYLLLVGEKKAPRKKQGVLPDGTVEKDQ